VVVLKERRAERERWERARQEAERRRAEQRLRDEEFQQKRDHLFALTRRWEAAERIRRFVDAAAQRAQERGDDLEHWLEWAGRYADTLDPLTSADDLDALLSVPDQRVWLGGDVRDLTHGDTLARWGRPRFG
jgi:MoxR-like ATPase